MASPEDFNSSDEDYGPAPNAKFGSAGQGMILDMLVHVVETRKRSKAFTKHLTDDRGSPQTQYKRAVWFNRLQEYRKVLGQDLGDPSGPDGKTIERFITTIIPLLKPRGPSRLVPAYTTITNALQALKEALLFEYETFMLSDHEKRRISATVQKHLHNGQLTNEPMRIKQWVGAVMVQRVVTAMMVDALDSGTRNWDLTLVKVTAIVLCSALGTRIGDIATNRLDDRQFPYLIWEDITVKLVGGSRVQDLIAIVLIRNEKNHKRDPQKNRTVVLKVLERPQDALDVDKHLEAILPDEEMPLADKVDNWKTEITQTLNRPNRTVLWKRGKRPVLPAFASGGSSALVLDKAGNAQRISRFLALGGRLAGFTAPVSGHDLRRGLARDMKGLKRKAEDDSLPDAEIASALGHSKVSLNLGTTDRYIGPSGIDYWSRRVQDNVTGPLDLQASNEPFKSRRLLRGEIDDFREEHGLSRYAAKHRLHQEQLEEWRSRSDMHATGYSLDQSGASTTDSSLSNPNDSVADHNEDVDRSDIDEEGSPIDPELLALGHEMGKLLAIDDDPTMGSDSAIGDYRCNRIGSSQ